MSTDKVDTEIPSPAAGVLTKILVAEDETVEVGAQLAVIGGGGGAAAPAKQEAPPAPAAEAGGPGAGGTRAGAADARRRRSPTPQPGGDYGSSGAQPAQSPPPRRRPRRPPAAAEPGGGDGSGSYVTPLVRRLASEKGVDLGSVSGSGVGGRIRKQDVLAAAEQAGRTRSGGGRRGGARTPSPAATPDTSVRGRTEKMSRLRAVIARRMVESLQVSAQLTTVVEADVTRIAQPAAAGEEGLRGARGRQALVPAVLRQGRRRGPEGAPVGELLDRPAGRHGHLPRQREPRHRGGHRARAAGAGHPRRRATSASAGSRARSPTWPSGPARTRSPRTSWAAARSR